jgi:hypothetical protein
MTHFGTLVGLLVGVVTLLSAMLGLLWRMASAWQRTQDMLKSMQDKMLDIIADKNADHTDFDSRLTWLERDKMTRKE